MLSALLNKRITIQKGTKTTTSMHSSTITYEDYCTIWSNVYVRSSVSQFNESETLLTTTEFTFRYNSTTKEIDNTYRINYNNSLYKILEVIETESKHTLKIIAQHWN